MEPELIVRPLGEEDVDAAAAAGMDGFVTKPVDAEYLYQVLQKAAASNKDSL